MLKSSDCFCKHNVEFIPVAGTDTQDVCLHLTSVSSINKLLHRLIYKLHVIKIITDSLHSNSFHKSFWQ